MSTDKSATTDRSFEHDILDNLEASLSVDERIRQHQQQPILSDFEKAIERATGEPIEQLREMPLDERRRMIEKRTGKKIQVVSYFPFIGRGH